MNKGRVIVRGDGEFIIARSEREVTGSRFGMLLRVGVGMALAIASLAILQFFWLN